MSPRVLLARVVDALHLLSLAAWMSAIVASGAAATAVFTMLPRSEVIVPAFAVHVDAAAPSSEERFREHGRIAGGMVMDPVFRWSDRAQAGLAVVALATFFIQVTAFRRRWPLPRRPLNVFRLACLLGAAALLAVQLGVLGPRMEQALHGWWDAARSGSPSADSLRTSFDVDHVLANRLYTIRLLLVVAAIALLAMAAVPSGTRSSSPDEPAHA